MSEHTPEPWFVGDQHDGFIDIYVRTPIPGGAAEDFTEDLVAQVCYADGYPPGEKGEANARLIATSPELLRALEDMLQSFGSTDWESVHDSARVQFARSVVAKAKGENL